MQTEEIEDAVRRALAEDLGPAGDVTTLATVPPDAVATARLVTRQPGVIAGLAVAATAFRLVGDGAVQLTNAVEDGARVEPGDLLASVTGPLAAILTGERTALNFLCHLSGVATLTRRWVDAIAGTDAR